MSAKRKHSGDGSIQNGLNGDATMAKIALLKNHSTFEPDDLPLSQEFEVSQSQNMDTCRFLGVEEVAEVLDRNDMSDVAKIFTDENICGSVLHLLTEEHLQNMGIQTVGKRLRVMKVIEEIRTSTGAKADQFKVFNDPIHGHIELHPLCVKIIDTPQFQRLRFLKQLGACYFVYPGAAHNRFEHCLGVCYLAGQLARALQRRQPELKITEKDILCVEIAGLCHDLGHGPFSHLFDGKFIPVVRPESDWKHEEASVKMFDYLVEDNDLDEVFQKYGLTKTDRTFIKEQIVGPVSKKNGKKWPYLGRSKEKSFLYEIVANKRNGIDVDKCDYFARDCHMLGIRNNFDHTRFMKFARVLEIEGDLQICSRDKEVGNLYDMFHTRMTLHRRAYQHQVNNIIETITLLKISESIDDMEAYTKLNDEIIHQILLSTDPNLTESKQILLNVLRRRLYKCVGQARSVEGNTIQKTEVQLLNKEILECIGDKDKPIEADDLIVHLVYLDYGMKQKNPIDHVRFYNKKDPSKAIRVRKDEVSQMLPEKFAEQHVRLYCKKTDPQSLEFASRCFQLWCEMKGFPRPKDGDTFTELTPLKSEASSGEKQTPVHKLNGEMPTTPSSAGKFKQRLSFD